MFVSSRVHIHMVRPNAGSPKAEMQPPVDSLPSAAPHNDELSANLNDDWVSVNRTAIEAHNHRVKRDGVFSDELRSF
jgi:hypothetical protein